MIVLRWPQDLLPRRAAVVREALERSEIPVLLVPIAARPRGRGHGYASLESARLGRWRGRASVAFPRRLSVVAPMRCRRVHRIINTTLLVSEEVPG